MPSKSMYTDVEAGTGQLYPDQPVYETPLRWAFIRKVYILLSIQMLLTVAVAATVVFVHPVHHFFVATRAGLGLYIFVLIFPLILICLLCCYAKNHPWNLLLLGLFTICMSFSVGLTCSFTPGKVILESAILTLVVVLSLTVYTFWAARKGHDFSFLGPFLFAGLMVLLVFIFIQVLFPMGKLSLMIYGALASLLFSGYIIYDTDNLIKRFSYDEYVWACVSLYLDIINLFLSLMTLFRAIQE